MTCVDPNPLNCSDFPIVDCEEEEVDPCATPAIWVCCNEYNSVDEAWKKTGISPHKLRFMANTTAFLNIYWA